MRIRIPDPFGDIAGPDVPSSGVDRRSFLRGLAGLGAGGALAAVLGPAEAASARLPKQRPPADVVRTTSFPDGVMAGDPHPDGCMLRTRVEAPPDGRALPVLWLVADDPDMRRIVAGGLGWARERDGHSFKVRVARLQPDRWYHYQFRAPGVASAVGRLRTAPAPGSSPDRLRYVFCADQQRNRSFYVAHREIAREDIDFVVHLGDYIYVNDVADLTLADYRRRWRIFQSHPDLQALQARFPIVPMFDDGEFYNGVSREGDPARLAAAHQAWFEAMPVPSNRFSRAYRGMSWGNLADFFLIDMISYADPDVPSNANLAGFDVWDTRRPPSDQILDPARTVLGAAQKSWLLRQLAHSGAQWRVLGDPENMHPWKVQDFDTPALRAAGGPDFQRNGGIYLGQGWDRFVAERRELLDFIERRGIQNVLVNSGQTHTFAASELQGDYDDPAARTVAFDFVTGSLTADPHWSELTTPPNPGLLETIETIFGISNTPNLKYVNLFDQGYVLVDLTPEEAILEFRALETWRDDSRARTAARFRVRSGSNQLETLFDERPVPRVIP